MSGWEGSTRRSRLPADWRQRRALVLRRDPICRLRLVCQGAPSTEADHRQPGDDHSLDNLQGACLPCHLKKSGAEGGRAPHTRSPHQRRRPAEPHPGILEP